MPIPEQFIDELVARSEISDVVSSYVTLNKKGNNLWGLCPFHNEKTPSFSVNQEKQIYHCFGCGKGGGVISFIIEVENLSFPDAVRLLAKRAGLEVPDAGTDDTGRKKKLRALEANREAARFYHEYLKGSGGGKVREYIAQRQIAPRTATRFGLGAAPGDWDTLTKALAAKGFSKMELIDAGLAVAGKNGGVYDKFRSRLMLPVIDVRGDVLGFTSRILPGEEGAKYLNTPETVVFKKGRLIYALNYAKNTKRPNLILVEGNIDVITLHQAGFDNVVATMGTALTEDHARLLARYTKELILCYDNDPAGKKSTDRVLNILKNADMNVRVLQLPNAMDGEGKPLKQDPDDFIKKFGGAAFERCLNGSAGQNDYKLDTILQKYDLSNPEEHRSFLKEAVTAAAALPGSLERDLFCRRVAAVAKISENAMLEEVAYTRRSRDKKEGKKEERKNLTPAVQIQPKTRDFRSANAACLRAEEGVLRLLMYEPALFRELTSFSSQQITSPVLKKAYELLYERFQAGAAAQITNLAGQFTPEEMSYLVEVLEKEKSLEHSRRRLADYIKMIEQEAIKRSVREGGSEDDLRALQAKLLEKKAYGG